MKPAISTAIVILAIIAAAYLLLSMKQECGSRHVQVHGNGAFECVAGRV